MSILNYFTIGFIFCFLVDVLLNISAIRKRLKPKTLKWGWGERICAVLVWPIGIIIFTIQFIKERFK